MFQPEAVWPVFVGTWIVLGVSGFVLFFLSRDANRKRRLLPWFAALTGLLFMGFIWAAGFPGGMVLAAIPIVAITLGSTSVRRDSATHAAEPWSPHFRIDLGIATSAGPLSINTDAL